jgi:maleylacetoacetate isomerase
VTIPVLYTYWRSSSAYRVRIGLNLKGIDYQPEFVHLVRDGGEQHKPEYRRINPQGLVPTLVDGEHIIQQSLAILEYLEETRRSTPLLPGSAEDRARIRALSMIVASDIQPVQNLRVLQYLVEELGQADEKKIVWIRDWISRGFEALELHLQDPRTGMFMQGDTPTMADCVLVPQYYNAVRFDVDMKPFPTINRIYAACMELDAFIRAAPENQPDAP